MNDVPDIFASMAISFSAARIAFSAGPMLGGGHGFYLMEISRREAISENGRSKRSSEFGFFWETLLCAGVLCVPPLTTSGDETFLRRLTAAQGATKFQPAGKVGPKALPMRM